MVTYTNTLQQNDQRLSYRLSLPAVGEIGGTGPNLVQECATFRERMKHQPAKLAICGIGMENVGRALTVGAAVCQSRCDN